VVAVVAVATDIRTVALGLGWRPEVASVVLASEDLMFVEVLAEQLGDSRQLPLALEAVRRRGVSVVPHGVSLSLGGAEWPDRRRLQRLARLAEALEAPFVSEHVAFVRSGRMEAGHLLPVPRTRDALDVLVENVRVAQSELPVPLALENVASLFEWPDSKLDEADFLTELLDRTGAMLLLDIANLYANGRNHGFDPLAALDRLPLERLAYVHVAGGTERDGVYVDTHAHPVPEAVLSLLAELAARCPARTRVMLERDRNIPPDAELRAELEAIAGAWHPAMSPRGA
jgi:uncharacterized protein (UPF0276 family)